MTKTSIMPLFAALVLAIVSYIVSHLFPIPGGLREVMNATGAALLDQRPSFSAEETYQRVAAFGEAGRALYRRFTLTTDIIFPLTWLPFLYLYARRAGARTSAALQTLMLAFPFAWIVTDVIENIFVWKMLTDFPARDTVIAWAIPHVTTAKWAALVGALAAPTLAIVSFRRPR